MLARNFHQNGQSFRSDTEYDVVTASDAEELKAAILSGAELVCEKFGVMWFRRAKRIAIAGTPIHKRETDIINF